MNVLVVAPHSDDEILGCGGTLFKHIRENDTVYSCIVTQAYTPEWSEHEIEERKVEINRVSELVGFKKVYCLDLPTVKLDSVPTKYINDMLYNIIREVKPEILYIPHCGDINRDHQIVFEAAMVASRPINDNVPKIILSYEVLSSTEWYTQHAFNPNVFVDISQTLSMKIKAMSEYKHGLRIYPHPRSIEGIISLAKVRGMASGMKVAESFSLVREIIK